VNRTVRKPGCGLLFVRHQDRIGVLAKVLEVISDAEISVKTMHNTIFDGTGSAVAAITLDQAPSESGLEALNTSSPHVLGIHWMAFLKSHK
jgi:D-3-phosphoglycerate dehydrogenase